MSASARAKAHRDLHRWLRHPAVVDFVERADLAFYQKVLDFLVPAVSFSTTAIEKKVGKSSKQTKKKKTVD